MDGEDKRYYVKSINEIRTLSNYFYSDYPWIEYPEILRKPKRPYNMAIFRFKNDCFLCVPFRTRLHHNNGFHFYDEPLKNGNNPGLDFSKVVAVKDRRYIGERVNIGKTNHMIFYQNIAKINLLLAKYVLGYIEYKNGIKTLSRGEYNRLYQFSTLKYFHNELDIIDTSHHYLRVLEDNTLYHIKEGYLSV